jgi:hypothetical protein
MSVPRKRAGAISAGPKFQPRSPDLRTGGGGGGGGGVGQVEPAGITDPSGQVTVGGGGGGGGGGHGCVTGTVDPSGQVCVFGVVAHAETATVATMISASRLIAFSLSHDFGLTTTP